MEFLQKSLLKIQKIHFIEHFVYQYVRWQTICGDNMPLFLGRNIGVKSYIEALLHSFQNNNL
jgi:hypothetical protein